MPLGDNIETDSRMTAAAMAKTDWRKAKWNGSPIFIRAAAAGLEVKDKSTPSTIKRAVAPRSQRSVVHHQMLRLERSSRAKV
jgi:hypothetical protein